MDDSTPDPEIDKYANKQPGLVNAGLDYGIPTENEGEEGVIDSAATCAELT